MSYGQKIDHYHQSTQLTQFSSRNLSAREFSLQFSNPHYILQRKNNEKYKHIQLISSRIRIFFNIFIVVVVLYFLFKIFYQIFIDMINEYKDFSYFMKPKRDRCLKQYIDNNCNISNDQDDELVRQCLEFEQCYKGSKQSKSISYLNYLAKVKDSFFNVLSIRTAVLLGIIHAIVLYIPISHILN